MITIPVQNKLNIYKNIHRHFTHKHTKLQTTRTPAKSGGETSGRGCEHNGTLRLGDAAGQTDGLAIRRLASRTASLTTERKGPDTEPPTWFRLPEVQGQTRRCRSEQG